MRKYIIAILFFLTYNLDAQQELSNEQIIEISDYIFQLEKKDSSFISGMQSIHTKDLDSILDPYVKFKRLLANYDTLYQKYIKLDSAYQILSKQQGIPKQISPPNTDKKDTLKTKSNTSKVNSSLNLPPIDSTYLREPIYKSITFEINTSILNKKFHADLDELVKLLKKNPKQKVHLEGSACASGNLSLNEVISAQRATIVQNYLIKNEIQFSRILKSSYVHDEANIPESERIKYRSCHIRLMK
jgi:outer membrane protein OmpA-like peptidoglycan-associated protein